MPRPISTRTSTPVIRRGGTDTRHPGSGTRVPARINEATCASHTRILIVVTAIKRRDRIQRKLRKSRGKDLEEDGIALTRTGLARPTRRTSFAKHFEGSVPNGRMSGTARGAQAAGRNV